MTEIDRLLGEYVERGAFPGAAYCFGTPGQCEVGSVGKVSVESEAPAVSPDTWWDLASITKVMATTVAAMIAVRDKWIGLDDPVRDYLSESKFGTATVRNLLLHNSGLPAYRSMTDISDAAEARTRILSLKPEFAPGEKTEYSCLGFIHLMAVIERVTGENLAAFVDREFFRPLGIDAKYCPDPGLAARCAPTEETPAWRRAIARQRGQEWHLGRYIQGAVHDPLAYALGGLSGNAGLFAPIQSVARFLEALCSEHEIFGGQLRRWRTVAGSDTSRALGFDTKSPTGSSAGKRFGPRSFGHTGYTGTCVWVDPDAKIFAALLTNRVHPRDGNNLITEARPAFFDLAFESARA